MASPIVHPPRNPWQAGHIDSSGVDADYIETYEQELREEAAFELYAAGKITREEYEAASGLETGRLAEMDEGFDRYDPDNFEDEDVKRFLSIRNKAWGETTDRSWYQKLLQSEGDWKTDLRKRRQAVHEQTKRNVWIDKESGKVVAEGWKWDHWRKKWVKRKEDVTDPEVIKFYKRFEQVNKTMDKYQKYIDAIANPPGMMRVNTRVRFGVNDPSFGFNAIHQASKGSFNWKLGLGISDTGQVNNPEVRLGYNRNKSALRLPTGEYKWIRKDSKPSDDPINQYLLFGIEPRPDKIDRVQEYALQNQALTGRLTTDNLNPVEAIQQGEAMAYETDSNLINRLAAGSSKMQQMLNKSTSRASRRQWLNQTLEERRRLRR